MDQPQLHLGQNRAPFHERELAEQVIQGDALVSEGCGPSARAKLALVNGEFILAHPSEGVPSEWRDAIDRLTQELAIDARWAVEGRPAGLIEKARRVVKSGSEFQQPLFAPWRVVSPTSFQDGRTQAGASGAQWAASYLFDFGPVRLNTAGSNTPGPIDLVLMSPCPETCAVDDAGVGPLPRISVLASMVRAAQLEGRKRLAIIVREAARATLATRLLGFDPSLNEASLTVEFLSIEEAVVRIQRGSLEWDALIAMPDLRGVVFAMLAEANGVTGPWPMLWFARELRLVTCEAMTPTSGRPGLDATALMQSMALLARHSGRQFAANCLYEGWAALRDRGIVTAGRSSSAPYVNEIGDEAFVGLVDRDYAGNTRRLPAWKAVSCQEQSAPKAPHNARLTLVS